MHSLQACNYERRQLSSESGADRAPPQKCTYLGYSWLREGSFTQSRSGSLPPGKYTNNSPCAELLIFICYCLNYEQIACRNGVQRSR